MYKQIKVRIMRTRWKFFSLQKIRKHLKSNSKDVMNTWHCFTWSEAARQVHSSSPFAHVFDVEVTNNK